MSETTVVLTLKKGRAVTKIEGTRVTFSSHQCFRFDDGIEDIECLRALGTHLKSLPGLALFEPGRFCDYLLKHEPELKQRAVCVVSRSVSNEEAQIHGLPVVAPDTLPGDVANVFLCETRMVELMRMRKQLPASVTVLDAGVVAEVAPESVPSRGWVALPRTIYPIDIPELEFKKGMDLILVDCPSRNLSLMPNGLAYVNNALKHTAVAYQIFDLDIVAYHRFHVHRLFDMGGRIVLPSGRVLPEDPWQAEHYDVWTSGAETASNRKGHNEVLDFFRPLLDEAIAGLVAARPKILGLSIQQCSEAISREIVRGVKEKLPETIVLVGGFSCYNADIGLRGFPEADYMCIGESDLTVGLLVEELARGERPFNQPGVLSRFDTPDYRYIPAPMVHNLDQIEFPKYEWADLEIYRNYNDYQLTPIIASRGCRWSRCTFCAERFYWRIRSPENFVDELQWLVDKGCHLFMFNESDLNGMPERVMEICDEIIRRGLHRKVKLTGQLRIHKKSDKAFFEKLREANFVALRFGVDAFSTNALRLQKKGYTTDMISQNLKDCWESGIYTEVNWVIGVPGETDGDVEEGIQLILANRKYIGRLANINPLILVNGSVYWIDPASHNVVFREPQDEMYAKFPRALPADSWYSTEPYIDPQVRKERFERIVLALHDAGFPVGAWAERVIDDVKLARDPMRGSSAKRPAPVGEDSEETVALEVSSQRAPISDEPKKEHKVIHIQTAAQKGNVKEEGKPAAAPPLHGVVGEPPRVVRKMENHDVVAYDGWYYGIPHAFGDVNLNDSDPAKMAGIVKHSTEEGVMTIINEAARWANTRGQYDTQDQQREAGSYMRAASALGESMMATVPEKPKILRYRDEYIAISNGVLKDAFNMTRLRKRSRSVSEGERHQSGDVEPRSPLRRLATKLPASVQQEAKRLIRMQSFESRAASGPLTTKADARLLRMLLRGAVDTYVKQPVSRLLRGDQHEQAARQLREVQVKGEDFFIISSVTKNALPELMWAIDNYNLVKFDGQFYGLPHGVPIDWEAGDVALTRDVFTGRTVQEVVSMIEATFKRAEQSVRTQAPTSRASGPAGEASTTPQLLGSLEGYNIVSYEGWVYGIPQELGPIDLTEIDVMEIPGVIRDVSNDVVENEILDRSHAKQQAA